MTARNRQTWAARTDIGRVRTHNEDSVLAQPPLFVVADGLGGHEAGEVASSIAVETVRDHAPRRADVKALARAVKAANREVLRAAKEGIGRAGMGTTITAALVENGRIALAHVGDSRAYLLRDGHLERVTEDHSMVADLIRRGQITEEESRVHPNRSVITRALGTDANMEADTYEVQASAGDRLMLCSDGLTSMLEDPKIAELLGGYREPDIAAAALIDAANEAGGHDNISVVVVDITEGAKPLREGGSDGGGGIGRLLLLTLGWVLAAALLIAGVAYGTYRYAQTRYFVIAENGMVVAYRGVPGDVAGYTLRWLVRETDVPVDALPLSAQKRLAEGQPVDGPQQLEAILAQYQRLVPASDEPTAAP